MTARIVTAYAPHITPDPPEWTLAAACQYVDAEIFSGCPVTAECLAFALEHHERFGIYGGLSGRERRRLAPAPTRAYAQRPIRHGTFGGYYTHRRRDETPCADCQTTASEAWHRRKQRRRSA